jgi:hypothetical protein
MKINPKGNKDVLVTNADFQRMRKGRKKFSLERLGSLHDIFLRSGLRPMVLGLDYHMLTRLCRDCDMEAEDLFGGKKPKTNMDGQVIVQESNKELIYRAVYFEMKRMFGVELRFPTYKEADHIIEERESMLHYAMGKKELSGFLTRTNGILEISYFDVRNDPFAIGVVIIA